MAARRAAAKPVVGVLSVQGDFREHLDAIAAVGAVGREVRLPDDLRGVSGLILPGGESTAMRRLLDRWRLVAPIQALASRGAPILGTCAGAILLATAIDDGDAPVLSLLDIAVRRNAFGRQLESFETDLRIDGVRADGGGATMHAVFIRAPELTRVGPRARPIAVLPDGRIVAARQGNIVGIAFHPELTGESRLHRWLAREAAGFDISSARR